MERVEIPAPVLMSVLLSLANLLQLFHAVLEQHNHIVVLFLYRVIECQALLAARIAAFLAELPIGIPSVLLKASENVIGGRLDAVIACVCALLEIHGKGLSVSANGHIVGIMYASVVSPWVAYLLTIHDGHGSVVLCQEILCLLDVLGHFVSFRFALADSLMIQHGAANSVENFCLHKVYTILHVHVEVVNKFVRCRC